MDWHEVPEKLDAWPVALAAAACELRKAALDIYTLVPVGYYLHAERPEAALYIADNSPTDFARCKQAALRTLSMPVRDIPLAPEDFAEPWVKVAFSQTLNNIGQALNFFPGQYPGGIPNHPSPLAALLTSGLVGAGLGWGTGKLIGKLMPEGYGDNLGRTGMILGGLGGAALPAVWGGVNLANGQSLLSSWPNDPRGGPGAANGSGTAPPAATSPAAPGALQRYLDEMQIPAHLREGLRSGIDLNTGYRQASDAFVARLKAAADKEAYGDTMADWAPQRRRTPADVNINALGQTLWELGAPPDLATTTMGAMYAAQQLPDPRSVPGWATEGQLGQLSENMGGDFSRGPLVGMALNAARDYFTGLGGGAILNAAVGTPYRASTFGLGNMALGVIATIVPRLFGH